jgi:hypothetical protein
MKGEEASPPTWVKPKLVALVKQAPDGPGKQASTLDDRHTVSES